MLSKSIKLSRGKESIWVIAGCEGGLTFPEVLTQCTVPQRTQDVCATAQNLLRGGGVTLTFCFKRSHKPGSPWLPLLLVQSLQSNSSPLFLTPLHLQLNRTLSHLQKKTLQPNPARTRISEYTGLLQKAPSHASTCPLQERGSWPSPSDAKRGDSRQQRNLSPPFPPSRSPQSPRTLSPRTLRAARPHGRLPATRTRALQGPRGERGRGRRASPRGEGRRRSRDADSLFTRGAAELSASVRRSALFRFHFR